MKPLLLAAALLLPPQAAFRAPEFRADLEWLNTARPLSMKALRGKVVLLDFWTYCCINCMHNLPELKRLEQEFPQALVVVGVHSAKFTTEQETDNIRQAVLRYEIDHPVVNDRDHEIWNAYRVQAWPTTLLIDPEGRVVRGKSGEDVYRSFRDSIQEVIAEFAARGLIDRRPLDTRLERARLPAPLLSFPGKVLADEPADRLFIADSNHNRIVVATLAGKVIDVAGRGTMGNADGSFDDAAFNHPQGMAFDRRASALYVADTENHTIRALDLASRQVTTIAGTGVQGRERNVAGVGRDVALNSPWDLVLRDGALYVAMAGWHQIWKHNLDTGGTYPHAGQSLEGLVDGPLGRSSLAQPSGLTSDGEYMYVADSESSAVRRLDFDRRGQIESLVGLDLFVFGDRDGAGDRALLQHPLGVTARDGYVYIADTYNNKIKRLTIESRLVETLAGSGKPDLRDGTQAAFDEPGGISIAAGKLYVADTNNHVIRTVDVKTRDVTTLALSGVEKLARRAAGFEGDSVRLPAQTLAKGQVVFVLNVTLPPGHKLNRLAPTAAAVSTGAGPPQRTAIESLPARLTADVGESGAVRVETTIYYCETSKEGLCYFRDVRFEVPFETAPDGASRVDLKYDVVSRSAGM